MRYFLFGFNFTAMLVNSKKPWDQQAVGMANIMVFKFNEFPNSEEVVMSITNSCVENLKKESKLGYNIRHAQTILLSVYEFPSENDYHAFSKAKPKIEIPSLTIKT